MFEKIIIIAIIAVAAAYLAWKFLSKKNRGKCGCGCDGCSPSTVHEYKGLPEGQKDGQPCCGCGQGKDVK
ncbi:FeoB-associated Cys-rich membrane protein [Desulfovibrio sp. OttesenSCG-928-C14]|nr:FeoB-associated Cys-rich membrane protein [Desulfovibrio sp. OttesenSCG-928-C14]